MKYLLILLTSLLLAGCASSYPKTCSKCEEYKYDFQYENRTYYHAIRDLDKRVKELEEKK